MRPRSSFFAYVGSADDFPPQVTSPLIPWSVRRVAKILSDKAYAKRYAKQAYRLHISNAKRRGVAWEFTFDQWWALWEASGRFAERGARSNQYVMARNGDRGPYAPGNVHICTAAENLSERARPLASHSTSSSEDSP